MIHQELEAKFGTDKAMGVYMELDSGETMSLEDYDALAEQVGRNKAPGAQSLFPDGSSAICCTNHAVQVFRAYPGRVQIFGFANENNPTSRVAREEIHPGGHDFAVLDGRYVVDPWIRHVAGESEQFVFDMHDADAALVLDIYGPRACWTHMAVTEEYALKNGTH